MKVFSICIDRFHESFAQRGRREVLHFDVEHQCENLGQEEPAFSRNICRSDEIDNVLLGVRLCFVK